MYYPSYEEIGKYEGKGNVVPISKEIMADITTPILLLRKIAKKSEKFFLLESACGDEEWGRYSFLGLNPYMRITLKDSLCRVWIEGELIREERVEDDAYRILREEINNYKSVKVEGLPSFTGGFVGYFAYEMIKYAEKKLKIKSNDVNDFDLMLFDDVICYDHVKQKIIVISNMKMEEGKYGYDKAVRDIDKIVDLIKENIDIFNDTNIDDEEISFECNNTQEEFEEVVNKTKNYIYEGDIFQAVLSRKFNAKYKGDLIDTYRMLRTTNPSPYMYYLQMDDIQIAGASPETLVRLIDKKLTTFPIAGTRPRGKTEEEDKALENELKGKGYAGTLPDIGKEKSKPKTNVTTPVFESQDSFGNPSELKPVPRDNPAFIDIIQKKDKVSEYVNDANNIIPMLEKLADCIEDNEKLQLFVTKANVLTLNIDYLQEKYNGKPESYYESFKKLQEVNRFVKSVSKLRQEAVTYQRYLAYSESGSVYNPENINLQLEYLKEELNTAIVMLREES